MKERNNLLFVVNVDWFFISHRLCIAEKAVEAGWNVTVAAEDTGRSREISSKGIHFVDLPFSRSGTNLFKEFQTIRKFRALYKAVSPDVVHHITLKPVIYGSLVARQLKVRGVLNAVSGLGYNFTGERKNIVAKLMLKLMKRGFKRSNLAFIFQNQNDYSELKELGVLSEENKINFIKGSGVDLTKFKATDPPKSGKIKILLPVRMLWDKGVAELQSASHILKEEFEDKIQLVLAGLADEENKAGVSATYLNEWQDGNYVKWIGYQKNMVEVYNDSHIVVLPSYREGMPKTLIEACAVGRPIVTTDAIGCRECVDEGVNGFKVPVKSSVELAAALKKLIVNVELRTNMGKASRLKAENEFDQRDVVKKHMEIYDKLLNE
jgi:glycosyltransferase involved in cell wall biosynthesis